ncbi:MAG: aldo/keto reductase [Treponema sp.]|nr:aldo/keto reductase [Treponema sp.]
MKTMNLGVSGLRVPALAVGCMRINKIESGEAARFVKTAMDLGLNFFDHADIYGGGTCEEVFAQAIGMNASVREKIILQSKCGIRPRTAYDFSKEHILKSVDGSLKRLKTDYLDVLLLHRPDALMEGEEVAAAFDALHSSGKVKFFGVSNQNPGQIKLLQKYIKQPLIADQLQLSITNCTMIAQGMHNNMEVDAACDRDGGILDFCRLNDITIQAWSPFQYGMFKGVFLGSKEFPDLNAKIDSVAKNYSVANTTIALAWILRHPAKIQPVTGTMNIGRLKDCAKAAEISISRDEWYGIYLAAGNTLP